jgi:hypothetical protein
MIASIIYADLLVEIRPIVTKNAPFEIDATRHDSLRPVADLPRYELVVLV